MKISNIAVVGAGNMGSGIAQKIATEGVAVVLVDSSSELAERGKQRIESLLQEGIERQIFKPEQVEQILGRVTVGTLEDLSDMDLVIEAVFENLEVKQELFRKLGEICRSDAILATNTSSFLVADMASVTPNPERVIGLHYFYHPAKNRLVEVIGHEGSNAAMLEAAWAFQELIGKTPIASKDAPGFIVNRFFVPWLNEAVRLHEEGFGIASIEAAGRKSFGIGMGPFELMNVTGVPIALHAATSLADNLGAFYAPAEALGSRVESGENWDLAGEPDLDSEVEIVDRLWGVIFHVALQLASEGVGSLEDTDIGARVGLRWPVGPFEMFNGLGGEKSATVAQKFAERYGLQQPDLLTKQVESGSVFELKRVELRVRDGVGTVLINRPDKLNALDPETVEQLEERFTQAEESDDVETIVIAGAGKAFVAGADVKFFVDKLKDDAVGEILSFTEKGQALFRRIEKCSKRVICCLDGMALGGGAELALACHAIVATPKASMAFPETGIGIYPGLGGTQRLTRRLGKGLGRYFLYTGQGLTASDLEALRLAWKVVPADELPATLRAAASEAPVQEVVDASRLPEKLNNAASILAEADVDGLLSGSIELPTDLDVLKLPKKLGHKAPRALRAVSTLTEVASGGDIDAGLQAELDHLEEIFCSADAFEGLSSVLERRRPTFQDA